MENFDRFMGFCAMWAGRIIFAILFLVVVIYIIAAIFHTAGGIKSARENDAMNSEMDRNPYYDRMGERR